MSEQHPIYDLMDRDPRFKIDAYQFVREALAFAHEELSMGDSSDEEDSLSEEPTDEALQESHLTGQELCEAIRQYALQQYGYLAKTVLNNWGVHTTGDFGEIVYNMIDIKMMRKSEDDRREDFDDVYEFEDAFRRDFEINTTEG